MSLSVFDQVLPTPLYPDAYSIQSISSIAGYNINAYRDSAGVNYNLRLGASSNVMLESAVDVHMYAGNKGTFKLYDTDGVGASRVDTEIFTVSQNVANATTLVNFGVNGARFIPGDATKSTTLGDLKIYDNAGDGHLVMTASNMPSGFRLLQSVQIDGSLKVRDGMTVGGDITAAGNIISLSDTFSKNHHFFKDSNMFTEDAVRVGYSFFINEKDQLELLKYSAFSNAEGVQEVYRKVAVFGHGTLNPTDVSSSNMYMAFDALSGISLEGGSGGAGSIPLTSTNYTNLALTNTAFAGTTSYSGPVEYSVGQISTSTVDSAKMVQLLTPTTQGQEFFLSSDLSAEDAGRILTVKNESSTNSAVLRIYAPGSSTVQQTIALGTISFMLPPPSVTLVWTGTKWSIL